MPPRQDLSRNLLAVLCILALIAASLWILLPFLAAAVWAAMIVVSTWPLFLGLENRLGGRRPLAVLGMSVAMLLLLVLPLWLAIDTIADHAGQASQLVRQVLANGVPLPPDWVAGLPLIGGRLDEAWRQLAAAGATGLVERVSPYAADATKWVLAQAGGLGGMLIQFLLVVLVSAIMYANGEAGGNLVRRFGRRLAAERGEHAVILAGQAIRGVALGVGLTALAQTLLGGIGLALAGVPFASLLSAVMLILCIAQVGPSLILFPAVGWMFWTGDTGWATFLLVWSLIVATMDNVLRPFLIKKGADLPLLLIFAGVIGGLLTLGLIGIFVGPVVLAVTWTLLNAWVDDQLASGS